MHYGRSSLVPKVYEAGKCSHTTWLYYNSILVCGGVTMLHAGTVMAGGSGSVRVSVVVVAGPADSRWLGSAARARSRHLSRVLVGYHRPAGRGIARNLGPCMRVTGARHTSGSDIDFRGVIGNGPWSPSLGGSPWPACAKPSPARLYAPPALGTTPLGSSTATLPTLPASRRHDGFYTVAG